MTVSWTVGLGSIPDFAIKKTKNKKHYHWNMITNKETRTLKELLHSCLRGDCLPISTCSCYIINIFLH
jgi:hypothetical protein